jgi:hypothetical protein
MAETLNKRIRPALAAEARENARRYWARKAAQQAAEPASAEPLREAAPLPGMPSETEPR